MEKDQKFWAVFRKSEDKDLMSLHELYLVYESELHKESKLHGFRHFRSI